MKLKGIKPIEQHIEKIVLGLVGVVFLAVLSYQFLVEPNKITVGKATVAPGQAFTALEEEATRLQSRMRETDMSQFQLPSPPEVRLTEQFKTQRVASIAPRRQLPTLGTSVALEGERTEGLASGAAADDGTVRPIAALKIPAPTPAIAHAFWNTIDPFAVAASPELKKLVPAQQPYDKLGVSVEASFDGRALVPVFTADPDGDGPARGLPPNWWRDSIEILAVQLERQERTASGWSEAAVVPHAAGSLDLLTEIRRQVRTAGDLSIFVNDARRFGSEILRPRYLPTIAGAAWLPPAQARQMMELARAARGSDLFLDLERVREDREAARQELETARTQAAAQPAPGQRQPQTRPSDPGSGEGTGGRPGAGGRPGTGSGGGASERDRERDTQREAQARVRQLTNQITQLDREERRIVDRIRQAGLDPEKPPQVEEPTTASDPTRQGTTLASRLMESSQIRIWAHDLTAKPGATYRYRLRVVINNPVFGRGASIPPEQVDMARLPTMLSEPGEWSAPIKALDETYYFLIGASEGDEAAPSSAASLEVYRLFYGYYRRGTVRVEPGDTIAATLRLPDANLLPIFDETKLSAQAPGQPGSVPQPPLGRAPADPLGGEGIMTPPGAGTGRGLAGGPSTPGRGETPGGVATGQPGQAGQPVQLPAGAQAGPKTLSGSIEAILLDVAEVPAMVQTGAAGQAGRQYRAFFRSIGDSISTRTSEGDRSSELYIRVAESAREGERQGQPKPEPEPTRREQAQPQRDRDRDRAPAAEPGGGGGGGGGGG